MATKRPKRHEVRSHQHQVNVALGEQEQNKYMISLVSSTMGYYIVLLFIKAYFSKRYFVNFYIDSAVALVCLIFSIMQLRYQYKFYESTSISKRPFIITIGGIIAASIITMLSLKSADIAGLVLVICLFVSKGMANKEWKKNS